MVKIRLKLKGRKNAPSYRIVAIDSKKKRDGKYIEDLGYYNPINTPVLVHIEKDRYNYWIQKGAQVSAAVKQIVDGKYKFVKYDPKAKTETEKIEETKVTAETTEEKATEVQEKKAIKTPAKTDTSE